MTDKLKELITADFFLQHETKYTQRWDHVEDHDDCYTWECSCGAIEESKFHSWEECHLQTRRHWAEKLIALLAEQAPAGEWDVQAWAYSIETPGGDMYEGEYAIFGDQMSAQRQVECLNDDIDEAAPQYKVVPLYRAAGRSSQPVEQRDPAGK